MSDFISLNGTLLLVGLNAALAFSMAITLAVAAWRNHFVYHTTRPAVLALMAVCFAWGIEFSKRLLLLAIPQTTTLYRLLSRSGWISDLVLVILLAAMGGLWIVLARVYPDVRRPKDSDLKPGGTD